MAEIKIQGEEYRRARNILGLFTEAPRRPREINASTPSNLTDYTAGGDADEIDAANAPGDPDDDNTDYTADDNEELETDDPGAGDDDGPDTGDDDDLTADAGGDEGGDTGDDDAGGGGDDGPDTGDEGGDDDLTAGTDDGGGDDAGGGDTGGGDDAGGDQGGKQNFKKENMQKYILFKRFSNMRTIVDNFIDQLEVRDANDSRLSKVYKDVQSKLKSISNFTYDYLVLKFQNDSYLTASYIYEQVKTAVLILIQVLQENHNGIAKEKDKTRKS